MQRISSLTLTLARLMKLLAGYQQSCKTVHKMKSIYLLYGTLNTAFCFLLYDMLNYHSYKVRIDTVVYIAIEA